MIETMAREFTADIIYQIVTPSMTSKLTSAAAKIDAQLFGGAELREAISKFEPNLIYSDHPLYAAQMEISQVCSKAKIPLILHVRGDLWREYWAWWFSREPNWSNRFRSLSQHNYLWASVLLARKVTPICKWLEKVLLKHVPWKSSEVVYQGIEPDQFYHEQGMEFQKPAIAIIQNHSIYPKVEGLLKFKPVVDALPHVHFYVAEGESTGSSYLSKIRAQYSGSANVEFVPGIQSPAAIRKMLSACDCYVLASGLDCCPTTVLEASLMRRPVIASRVGGVPEIILQNETGWTIDNGSVSEWIETITNVLNDEKLRRRMGEKGRKWVSATFGWKKIAGQIERIVNEEAVN
jgi:glycosyltransferase involved in cell wall biosynthesis